MNHRVIVLVERFAEVLCSERPLPHSGWLSRYDKPKKVKRKKARKVKHK